MISINEFIRDYEVSIDKLAFYGIKERDVNIYGDEPLNELPDEVKVPFMAALEVYGYFVEGSAI